MKQINLDKIFKRAGAGNGLAVRAMELEDQRSIDENTEILEIPKRFKVPNSIRVLRLFRRGRVLKLRQVSKILRLPLGITLWLLWDWQQLGVVEVERLQGIDNYGNPIDVSDWRRTAYGQEWTEWLVDHKERNFISAGHLKRKFGDDSQAIFEYWKAGR